MRDISSIVALYLEREAWKEIEKVSKRGRNRPVHALANHRVEDLAQRMCALAMDEKSKEDSDSSASDEEENVWPE